MNCPTSSGGKCTSISKTFRGSAINNTLRRVIVNLLKLKINSSGLTEGRNMKHI